MFSSYHNDHNGGLAPSDFKHHTGCNHRTAATSNAVLGPAPPASRDNFTGGLIYTCAGWHPACLHSASLEAAHARKVSEFEAWHAAKAEWVEIEKQANAAQVTTPSRQVPLPPAKTPATTTLSRQVHQMINDVVRQLPLFSALGERGGQKDR
jgi:hypothetical protein